MSETILCDALLCAIRAEPTAGALTLSALTALADFLLENHRAGEARAPAQEALDLAMRLHGPNSLPVAAHLLRLGRVEYLSECAIPGRARDNSRTVTYLERALTISEEQNDRDGIVDAIRLLTTVLPHVERAEEGERLARRAVGIEQEAHGPRHVKTANAGLRLARYLLFSAPGQAEQPGSRHDEVLALLAAVGDATRESVVRGDSSVDEAEAFVVSTDIRSGLLGRLGRHEEGIADLEIAVAYDRGRFGEDSVLPGPLGRRRYLAALLHRVGRSREALPLLQRAVDAMRGSGALAAYLEESEALLVDIKLAVEDLRSDGR